MRRCRERPWWDPRRWLCVIRTVIRYIYEWVTETVEVWHEWRECEQTGGDYHLAGVTDSPRYVAFFSKYSNYFTDSKRDHRKLPNGKIAVKFLGTNCVFITDGITNLIIDPFFTRPDVNPLAIHSTWVRPLAAVIQQTLLHAGIDRLDAILMTHAHYDHAMDIGEVARQTADAQGRLPEVYGCESVKHVALGAGLPDDDNIKVVEERVAYRIRCGQFIVNFLPAEHTWVPVPFLGGDITSDLNPSQPAGAYKEGTIHAIRIEHPSCTILNLGSAAYRSDSLDGVTADYLIFGVAGYDTKTGRSKAEIYDGTVRENVNPDGVLFTHWDNFRLRLDKPPEWFKPLPWSKPEKSVGYFREHDGRDPPRPVKLMRFWDCVYLPGTF